MSTEDHSEEYLWIMVDTPEQKDQAETFFGLVDDDGTQFIPVCRKRGQCESLMSLLPTPEGAERSIEAIHREQLMTQAPAEGFAVFVVDAQGKVLERLS